MEGEELWLDFYLYTIAPDTQEVLVRYLPFPFRYLPVMLHGIARATLNKDGRLARLSNGTAFSNLQYPVGAKRQSLPHRPDQCDHIAVCPLPAFYLYRVGQAGSPHALRHGHGRFFYTSLVPQPPVDEAL